MSKIFHYTFLACSDSARFSIRAIVALRAFLRAAMIFLRDRDSPPRSPMCDIYSLTELSIAIYKPLGLGLSRVKILLLIALILISLAIDRLATVPDGFGLDASGEPEIHQHNHARK